MVDVVADGLLRTHVAVGADDVADGFAGADSSILGDAEVNDSHFPIRPNHNI